MNLASRPNAETLLARGQRLLAAVWHWCCCWLRLWKGTLPTGEKLEREAECLGGTLHETWKGGAQGHTILDEPELQRRVLAARTARQSAVLNFAQTAGIIGTLLFYVVYMHAQSVQKSAELMLAFDQRLNSGSSALVAKALEEHGNLNKIGIKDVALEDAIDDFLGNYELLDAAYRHNLIDKDMAEDAFSYDLEKALRDAKVRQFLAESEAEESDIYDGVLELARSWKIKFPPISPAGAPAAHASPRAP
jgi:hypothetical protein